MNLSRLVLLIIETIDSITLVLVFYIDLMSKSYFRMTAIANSNQATIKNRPPIGVIAPNILVPV